MINVAGRLALVAALGVCAAGCGASRDVAHSNSAPASSTSSAAPSSAAPSVAPSPTAVEPPASAPATSPVPSAAPPSETPKSVPGVAAWLYTSNVSLAFIQMQEDAAGDIGGTEYGVAISGTAPAERVSVTPTTFSGQIVGNAVTLNILDHTDYGTVSDSVLTLNVLQTDGSIQPVVYKRASPTDYNAALAALTAAAGTDNAAENQRQANAKAQASASAAAQAAADTPVCNAVGGQFSDANIYAECHSIPYLGTDHSTYYGTADMTPTGAFDGPMDTAGTGATQQECTTGYYPDLSTGPGHAPPGHWNDPLQVCLP